MSPGQFKSELHEIIEAIETSKLMQQERRQEDIEERDAEALRQIESSAN